MKKALFFIIAVLVILPILPHIIPKPASIERLVETLKAAGCQVTDPEQAQNPMLEAANQWTMSVDDARVDLYRFDDEGKIAKQFEYQKKDVGSAIVEAWNLGQALGAAPDANVPTYPARNGRYLLVVTTPDKELAIRIVQLFSEL